MKKRTEYISDLEHIRNVCCCHALARPEDRYDLDPKWAKRFLIKREDGGVIEIKEGNEIRLLCGWDERVIKKRLL